MLLERSGVARVGLCCTFEEENWGGQQLSKFLRRWTGTCLQQKGLYSPPTNAYGLAGPAQASAGYHVVELP